MPESSTHMEYVNLCGKYLTEHILPQGCDSYLLYDKPDSIQKPPAVEGGVHPDLYYQRKGLLVIGEAKTLKDVDNPHSRQQYECYFKECELFEGESVVAIITTWSAVPLLWSIVKRIKINGSYKAKVIVLYELGVYKQL